MADIESAWPAILASIAAGELVKDTIARHGIKRTALSEWMLQKPVRKVQWEEAREASADAFMDQAMHEAMTDHPKDLAPHIRTRIDTLKWAARIRNPKLYGDKAQLDVNVRTVDLTRIIEAANARLAARVMPNNSAIVGGHAHALPAVIDAEILRETPLELAALL